VSLLPEFILQAVLVRGIRALRNDSRLIDQLFRNLDQKSLAGVRAFIKEQLIDLGLNYPRDQLKVPAIIILLRNSAESSAFLGDSMGVETPDLLSYDGDVEDEILGSTASVTSMSGQGLLTFGPYTAAGGTANTLRITRREWEIDKFRGRNLLLNIVAGTGLGQSRGISANSQDTIMVSTAWSTIPDATSVFEVRATADETVGEPSKAYDRRNPVFVERRGHFDTVSYQIQMIGANPEQAIYMTAMVKAIFVIMRTYLERQGIINLKMTVTDFVPRTEYQPDFAYMRAMTVEFVTPFDVFEELSTVQQIQTAIEAEPANSDDYTPVVIENTINVGPPATTVGP
jgi:hypothetical protein